MPNTAPTTSESKVATKVPAVGAVTRTPGKNRPRIHLVSSKGKIPAEVYVQAVKIKQNAAKAAKMPSKANTHPEMASNTTAKYTQMKENPRGGNPRIDDGHNSNPSGVAPYAITPTESAKLRMAGKFAPGQKGTTPNKGMVNKDVTVKKRKSDGSNAVVGMMRT